MTSLISKVMGATDMKLTDQVIANQLLLGLKTASAGYLWATLESATPEVRRLFSEYLAQSLLAHEGLTALSVKRGWYQPYLNPEEQLSQVFKQSEWVINANA